MTEFQEIVYLIFQPRLKFLKQLSLQKQVGNKKKKLEDDDKHWITSGYEGTEILVKGSDIHNLLDEDVDEGLFGENDNDLVSRVKKETGGSVDE